MIPKGKDAGKRLFFSDYQVGEGQAEQTFVFVHGNPESSYTFRHIRDALLATKRNFRLVAMDHIGFGLSDRATYEMIDMHHAENLRQLVQYLNLKQVSLVAHDWGGPIGIGAFLSESNRVDRLVVMNTTVFPMPNDGMTYANYPITWFSWCKTAERIPDKLWGGLAAYVVSHAKPQGTIRFLTKTAEYVAKHASHQIPKNTSEYVWSQMLRDDMNARSSKRNVRQTPVWGHGYSYVDKQHGKQSNHDFFKMIQTCLPREWGPKGRRIPVIGHFGQWDPCGKESVIAQWLDALPQMQGNLYRYPDVGHFVEESKGEEIAASLL